MTDTHPNTTEAPSGRQPVIACSACGHPWAEHDQIAARYCAATTTGRHDRGCVCAVRTETV